jgi:hypothetical protein
MGRIKIHRQLFLDSNEVEMAVLGTRHMKRHKISQRHHLVQVTPGVQQCISIVPRMQPGGRSSFTTNRTVVPVDYLKTPGLRCDKRSEGRCNERSFSTARSLRSDAKRTVFRGSVLSCVSVLTYWRGAIGTRFICFFTYFGLLALLRDGIRAIEKWESTAAKVCC